MIYTAKWIVINLYSIYNLKKYIAYCFYIEGPFSPTYFVTI